MIITLTEKGERGKLERKSFRLVDSMRVYQGWLFFTAPDGQHEYDLLETKVHLITKETLTHEEI